MINYNEVDFVDAVLKRTDKRGVDLVVEHVGGDFLEKSIRCLTRGGRVVTVGDQVLRLQDVGELHFPQGAADHRLEQRHQAWRLTSK